MRAYWILPNREQKDEVLASDGRNILPLREILDPKTRPDGFSHGVPAEILEKYAPAEILFAQKFPARDDGRQLFCVSMPAGVDTSGRMVHLGLLFILERGESPDFDLPTAGLPHTDQSYARVLLRRVSSPEQEDTWARSVRELSDLRARKGPATNVELERSAVPFYSLYVAGRGGKLVKRGKPRVPALVLVILVTVAGMWLSAHACGGVERWRFN